MSPEFLWPEKELPRRAVIVGINEYSDPKITPNLEGAENDATDMYQILQDYGGFEITESHYLLGPKATCKAIRKAISDLLWATDECFLSLFYFSGHGMVDSYGNLYLAPHDIERIEPFTYGIDIDELRKLVSKSKNKDSILLVLDCCYSGIGAKGDKSADDITAQIKSSLRETIEQAKTGKGKIILTSSGMDQKSRELTFCKHRIGGDSHPHGIYTFHMLEGLVGAAMDEECMITLGGLQKYIDSQLLEKGSQQPTSWAAELSGREYIRIAVASDAFNDLYNRIIKGAEEMYSKSEDPVCILSGIDKISGVLTKIPAEKKALDLKDKFTKLLKEYKSKASIWLGTHRRDVRSNIEKVYKKLELLVPSLSFDQISELSSQEFALLSYLFEVTAGKISTSDVQIRCEPFNNPSSTSGQTSVRAK